MTEQELLEKIKQSADSIVTPESLAPENLPEKCQNTAQENTNVKNQTTHSRQRSHKLETSQDGKTEQRRNINQRDKRNQPNKIRTMTLSALAAAALFLLCLLSLQRIPGIGITATDQTSAGGAGNTQTAEAGSGQDGSAASETGTAGADADTQKAAIERKDAGDLYTLAKSYDAVYDSLEEISEAQDTSMSGSYDMGAAEADGSAATAGIGSIAEAENSTAQRQFDYAAADGAAPQRKLAQELSTPENHSETNVQTLGIDESDIVKTDGRYLYLLRGSSVSIVSAAGKTMRQISELEADGDSGAAAVRAMYVDGDTLTLILSEYSSSLQQEETGDRTIYDYDLDYLDTDLYTSVLTYDISDRSNPVLAGKVSQDGNYVTSRKDGAMLYLFTEQYLLEDYRHDPESAIPQAGGRKVSADCIYLGERGERALLVSSLSTDQPKTVRDTVMLLDAGSEIYMGENSLYLYRTVYRNGSETTQIAKFSLEDGYLNGEAAASVRGAVRDTFAIHEKADKLRILTTDTSGTDPENCLFLLDEKLKLTGTLSHIAVGESIYAARFLGDMAYFITYRNTDPLFAADLSDETNPKLVGELKITGFSEYLHFWGQDKLLGIGYETDPETGTQKGLKLVMFDMSDPADLKVLGSKVLDKASYSPALYDYKAVLADPAENLIGFVSEDYRNNVKRRYELYQWNGKEFQKILSEDLKDGYEGENYRGLYIGNRFYIAHPEILRLYDRKDYSLVQTLTMNKK